MASAQMSIRVDTKKLMDDIKLVPNETYDHVIQRLIVAYKEFHNLGE
jgi:hypothetical protein